MVSSLCRALLPLALGLLAAACAPRRQAALPERVHADLAGAERFELLALDPVPLDMRGSPTGDVESYHGHEVLCRAEVKDAAVRREILELVERGIRESDGTVAACFNPRHGVRAERAGHVSELVICFECLSLDVYADGERVARPTTLEAPAARMNELWKAHGCEVVARD